MQSTAKRNINSSLSNTKHKVDSAVHGSFWPVDIRREETSDCTVYVGDKRLETKLWRLSPLGGEFLDNSDKEFNIKEGDEVNIGLYIGEQKCEFSGLAVCSQTDSKYGKIFGVRWVPAKQLNRSNSKNTRKSKRWICSEAFLPSGVVTNPHKFHDIILFKVIDISASEFQLRTSLRNKFLIPGMVFSGTFSFPLIGKSEIKFEIKNTILDSVDEKEILRLGIAFINPSKVLSVIAQYAIQFSNVESIDELETEGLKIKGLSKKYEVSYSKTEEDFQKFWS